MQFEHALVARICHDLITPFNAINLGIEAFEVSRDEEMLMHIKSSTNKASAILKFMRELFSAKGDDFCYTKTSLQQMISEILAEYKITFVLYSEVPNIPNILGKMLMYLALICKEHMPCGGSVKICVQDSDITCECVGRSVKTPEINDNMELTHKTVIRHCLLRILQALGCKIIVSQEVNKSIITVVAN